MSRMEHVAPAGTPIRFADLSRWALRAVQRRSELEAFAAAVRARFGVRHCFFVSSGRAAMVLLLRSLAELAGPERDEVILPAYTCYSVAASVLRAGLRVRVCDVDPETLSYRTEGLAGQDFSRVLAVVSANLYGIPNDLPAIEAICRQAGVFLVDDAAQCLDGRIGGRFAGSFGDAGLFSLDKGKNITSIQGGIIVSNSDAVAQRLQAALAALAPPARLHSAAECLKLLIYAVFLRPPLYWIPERLLSLGDTVYTTEYPITRYSGALGAMASLLFERLDAITAERVRNGTCLRALLAPAAGMRNVRLLPDARPVYARLPVLLNEPERRRSLVTALRRAGIGASESYPATLLDLAPLAGHVNLEQSHAEGARRLAERIVTLPTHPYVQQRHLEKISTLIINAL